MNIFDVFIIAVIAFCLIRGFFRGFIKEASSIVAVLSAFYGAFTYYPVLAVKFETLIATPLYQNILSFFIIFCVVVVVVNLAAALIRYLLRIVFLGWVDRCCGIIFGALKGIIIVSILFVLMTSFLPGKNKFLAESALAPHIAVTSEILSVFLADDIKKEIQIKFKGINEIWKKHAETVRDRV
ncbi:MAG: CvpA family protein [Thermodesulfobacteriota bacterium]|nr:CvpA family protein [Thermodesulfobacteriota bacterium]